MPKNCNFPISKLWEVGSNFSTLESLAFQRLKSGRLFYLVSQSTLTTLCLLDYQPQGFCRDVGGGLAEGPYSRSLPAEPLRQKEERRFVPLPKMQPSAKKEKFKSLQKNRN